MQMIGMNDNLTWEEYLNFEIQTVLKLILSRKTLIWINWCVIWFYFPR